MAACIHTQRHGLWAFITVDAANAQTARMTTNSVSALVQDVADLGIILQAKIASEFDTRAVLPMWGILVEEKGREPA